MAPPRLRTADRYHSISAMLARRAAREAAKAGRRAGYGAAALTVMQYQAAQAAQVPAATAAMLAEQGITVAAGATLQAAAFATPALSVEAMMADVEGQIAETLGDVDRAAEALWTSWQFERLVTSLTQDAAREAQQVDVASRPRIAHVRHLVLPSCSRCAVLAGRVYRWSEGFKRHPGCDCVMIPTTVANDQMAYDLTELAESGQVAGLSRADRRALADGADFNQVVNAGRKAYSPTRRSLAGSRLGRGKMRLPVADIYRQAKDRADALRLLKLHGYVL